MLCMFQCISPLMGLFRTNIKLHDLKMISWHFHYCYENSSCSKTATIASKAIAGTLVWYQPLLLHDLKKISKDESCSKMTAIKTKTMIALALVYTPTPIIKHDMATIEPGFAIVMTAITVQFASQFLKLHAGDN